MRMTTGQESPHFSDEAKNSNSAMSFNNIDVYDIINYGMLTAGLAGILVLLAAIASSESRDGLD